MRSDSISRAKGILYSGKGSAILWRASREEDEWKRVYSIQSIIYGAELWLPRRGSHARVFMPNVRYCVDNFKGHF